MIELYKRYSSVDILQREAPFFQFPGGEWHMAADDDWSGTQIAWVSGSDVNDYVKMALWSRVVAEHNGTAHAVVPYFPAARSDRGTPTGADVYADLIKCSWLDSLSVFDPHSYHIIDGIDWGALPVYYSGLHNIPDLKYFEQKNYTAIIAPDKGAISRAADFAKRLGLPLVVAGKERNFETGELSGFSCEWLDDGLYLVLDDICDGGGTFNGLADVIHAQNPNVILDLFVSHGIFSKGLDELKKRFDEIFATNSLDQSRVINPMNLFTHTIDIKKYMIGKVRNEV